MPRHLILIATVVPLASCAALTDYLPTGPSAPSDVPPVELAPQPAATTPTEDVAAQVDHALTAVEEAYATLPTLTTTNSAVMSVFGQQQQVQQELQWDVPAKTMSWARGPLTIQIARSTVTVIRQGHATHRSTNGDWAATLTDVLQSPDALPVELRLHCGVHRDAWLEAATGSTIGLVEVVDVKVDPLDQAEPRLVHFTLKGEIGHGTMQVDAHTKLLHAVQTTATVKLPDGQPMESTLSITFVRN